MQRLVEYLPTCRRSPWQPEAWLPALAVLLASACSSPTPGGSAACGKMGSVAARSVEGALVIGEGGPDDFRPIADNTSEELVLGSQGGYMVTPVLRIDAELLGTDGSCPTLDVTHAVESLSPAQFHFNLPAFDPKERYWYVGSLPLFLSWQTSGLVGKSCVLSATFHDQGVAAMAEVHTKLIDND